MVEILIGEGYLGYARALGLINECNLKEILGMLFFLGLFKLGEYAYTLSRGRGGVGLNWGSRASFWSILSPTYRLVYQYMKSLSWVFNCSISVDFVSKGCCPFFVLLWLLKH